MHYIGRFAPSPTGPLHQGSLVAAMASYLDARSHGGHWLVRIEDIDETRTVPGCAGSILHVLRTLGMQWDGEVVWQSRRKDLYQNAFQKLSTHIYPCGCTRREIADSQIGIAPDGAAIYPGTCRNGLASEKSPRTYRLRVPEVPDDYIQFDDRWLGTIAQHLATEAGDFVLKRADGFWAYQLAVVVDDDQQGITHIVRGADLLDSTPRQIFLQQLLGVFTPAYLHVPVVANAAGEKLSKQTGARAIDFSAPLQELSNAARFLDLEISCPRSIEDFWQQSICAWKNRFNIQAPTPTQA